MINDPIAKLLGDWSSSITIGSICLRLGISILFSAIIGCERANKRHSAGLRTFILVTLASTLCMLLDMAIMENSVFPIPAISAMATIGIAMLSGNSVLFSSRSQIKGLTTSTGLWTCGIVGLTIGAGLYTVAIISFVLLLCILTYLPAVEGFLKNRSNHFEIHLELKSKANLQDFMTTIRRLGMIIVDIEVNNAYISSGLAVYSIMITINSKELKKYKTHSEIIKALSTLDYVYHIEEMM